MDGPDRTYGPSVPFYHDGITFCSILLISRPILSISHLQPESPTDHQDYSPSHSRAVGNPNRLTSWSLCRLVIGIVHFPRQAPVHGENIEPKQGHIPAFSLSLCLLLATPPPLRGPQRGQRFQPNLQFASHMWFIWHPIKPGQGDLTSGIRRTWKGRREMEQDKKDGGKIGERGGCVPNWCDLMVMSISSLQASARISPSSW